jgi:hypothetical protein
MHQPPSLHHLNDTSALIRLVSLRHFAFAEAGEKKP